MGSGRKVVPYDLARRDDESEPTEVGVPAHERRPRVQWLLRFEPFGGSCVEFFFRGDCGRSRIFGGGSVRDFTIRQLC